MSMVGSHSGRMYPLIRPTLYVTRAIGPLGLKCGFFVTSGEDHPDRASALDQGPDKVASSGAVDSDPKARGNTAGEGSEAPGTSGVQSNFVKLNCVSFNCKGFKGGSDYLAQLLADSDILCLSETWLRPGELIGISLWLQAHPLLSHNEFTVFAKSSMSDTDHSSGRPFGGLCTIIRNSPKLRYREVDCDSDRIIPVGIYDSEDNLLQVVCNVYMPFCASANTDLFIQTIDVLQYIIDTYNAKCPVKFYGDFNANVPKYVPACASWYRSNDYRNIMTDSGGVSNDVTSSVDKWFTEMSKRGFNHNIVNSQTVSSLIHKLNNNCAAGFDGLTSEHLKYGHSDILCAKLSDLLTAIMSWQTVPSSFNIGVIVPVLKKPSLNPNDASNYRPITLSSTLSKMLESLLLPVDNASNSQFGFRHGRGTAFACTLFNDCKAYFEHSKSPLYTCSLDAEKCFDSICHYSLFYKLWGKIPNEHWLLFVPLVP